MKGGSPWCDSQTSVTGGVVLPAEHRANYQTPGAESTKAYDLLGDRGVLTAAAAIMIVVFGVFIFDPNVFVKQIGLGLAAAVLIDATIVRMVLVPATVELLSDANWWIPRWLDRILPSVHIEAQSAADAELAALIADEQVNV